MPSAPLEQNPPSHNQSSTNSIREEDSIDISEQGSTKSSPAWETRQDSVNLLEPSWRCKRRKLLLKQLGA